MGRCPILPFTHHVYEVSKSDGSHPLRLLWKTIRAQDEASKDCRMGTTLKPKDINLRRHFSLRATTKRSVSWWSMANSRGGGQRCMQCSVPAQNLLRSSSFWLRLMGACGIADGNTH